MKSRSDDDRAPLINIDLWRRHIRKEVLRDSRALRSRHGYFGYYMALAERVTRLAKKGIERNESV